MEDFLMSKLKAELQMEDSSDDEEEEGEEGGDALLLSEMEVGTNNFYYKKKLPSESCGYCGSEDDALVAQCRRCAITRYCSLNGTDAHQRECFHGRFCTPVPGLEEAASLPTPLVVARPPADLCCPITRELFVDPVRAADGECYERAAIERWVSEKQAGLAAARRELEAAPNEAGRYLPLAVLATGVRPPMGHSPPWSTPR